MKKTNSCHRKSITTNTRIRLHTSQSQSDSNTPWTNGMDFHTCVRRLGVFVSPHTRSDAFACPAQGPPRTWARCSGARRTRTLRQRRRRRRSDRRRWGSRRRSGRPSMRRWRRNEKPYGRVLGIRWGSDWQSDGFRCKGCGYKSQSACINWTLPCSGDPCTVWEGAKTWSISGSPGTGLGNTALVQITLDSVRWINKMVTLYLDSLPTEGIQRIRNIQSY